MSASTGLILPRPDQLDRDRWAECARKQRVYETRDRAERAADIRTKWDRDHEVEARPWTAYNCRFCGSYHIGHVRKVEPCGLCDIPHKCCCPRLRSGCTQCMPWLIGENSDG